MARRAVRRPLIPCSQPCIDATASTRKPGEPPSVRSTPASRSQRRPGKPPIRPCRRPLLELARASATSVSADGVAFDGEAENYADDNTRWMARRPKEVKWTGSPVIALFLWQGRVRALPSRPRSPWHVRPCHRPRSSSAGGTHLSAWVSGPYRGSGVGPVNSRKCHIREAARPVRRSPEGRWGCRNRGRPQSIP
jgi:hypothetical protein